MSASTRGTATRERIMRRAEQLFAQRGASGVTLREIARAAGQRNVAAVQYHFGGKQELLGAILSGHLEAIDQRRRELLDADEQAGRLEDEDALLSVLVDPLAEKLDDASGRAYLQIQARRPAADPMRPATHTMAGRLARAFGTTDGEPLLDRFAVLLLFGALADRARQEERGEARPGERARFVSALKAAIRGIYVEGRSQGEAGEERLAG